MSDFKLTTIDEFDAATDRLLETGRKIHYQLIFGIQGLGEKASKARS